ncbi:uncharacterized protein BX663DRAFT_541032 [Cokeromyces recurvatus]|uniref:uncharacterized protein n=1 Tax=Cokeromyces recurvatus TaxID=90255 RepID=UPI00221F1101|nr:uncharacterized protein BX663DRAFT_541032 [Cokeromyces recurvatus]KAI7905575.1 hypothetical protein BX663DRAFT_541032 [Cokeromyces recurvatus]
MDLSWCIICDRHCIDNNLYCSEVCRFQDSNNAPDNHDLMNNNKSTTMVEIPIPPSSSSSSPVLTPFLYSFQSSYDRRRRHHHHHYSTPFHSVTSTSFHSYHQPSLCSSTASSVSSLYVDNT